MVLSGLNEGVNSFRRLAENLPGIVYRVLIEDDNRTIFFNDMVQTMTGYSPEDLKKGKVCSIDPLILPEDRLHVINIVKDAIENNVPFEVEYRINNKSGELKWFFDRGRPIRGDNGKPSYIDGVIFDITKRKRMELILLESKNRYQFISENVNDMISILNEKMRYEYVNEQAFFNIMGRKKEALIGKSAVSWVHPEDVKKCRDVFKMGFETGKAKVEARFKDKNGDYHWFEIKGKTFIDIDGKKKGLTISRDITKHKQLENDLENTIKKLDILNRIILSGNKAEDLTILLKIVLESTLKLMNFDGGGIYLVDKTNRTAEIVYHKNVPLDFFEHAKKVKINEGNYRKIFIEGVPLYSNNYPQINPERAKLWNILSIASIPLFSKNKVIGALNIASKSRNSFSIAEKKLLQTIGRETGTVIAKMLIEQNLKESEEKYRYLFNNAQVGLYWSGISDGEILECNNTFAKLFGYDTREECLVDYNAIEHYIDTDARSKMLEEIRDNKEVKNYEIHVTRKDGTPIWLSISARVFEKEDRIEGAAIDVTERKKTEQKLKENTEFIQNVFNAIQDGLSVLDLDLNIVKVNPYITEMYGSIDQIVNRKCYDVYQKKSSPCPWCPSIKTIETGQLNTSIVPYPTSENPTGWLELTAFPLKNSDGIVEGIIEYVKDITEHKQAERELQLERDNFLNILNSMEDGVYIVDQNYDIEYVNPSFIKEFGHFEGMKCFKYFEDRNEICPRCKNKEVFQGKTVRWEWYSPKSQKTYDVIDTPLKNPDGSISKLGIFRDETDKKQAELKLKESEEEFRKQNIFLNNILESLTHPFYVINVKDYKVILANSTASSEGLEHGQYCYSLTHNNNKPCAAPCMCPLEEVKNTKKSCVVEHVHYDKEGNEKIYEIYGYPILDENGNVVQMIEYTLNISDRKKAETNLRKIAHQWQTTFDAMSEAVFLLDMEQNILQCNKATLDVLGKEKYEEIIGHSCCEIMHGTNEPVEWCPMVRMIESGRKESSIAQIGDRWCDISVDPVINDEGTIIGAVHVIKDITEQKQIQKAIQEKQATLEGIFRAAPIGIGLVKNRVFTQVNDGFCNLVGYTRDELLNKNARIVYPSDEDYEYAGKVKYEQINKFGIGTVETRFQPKDGRIIDVLLSSVQLDLNNIFAGETFTALDITESKKVEQELIKLNNMKSKLLRRTSHELKTPLVSIKGFSDLLLELHRDILDDYVIRTIEQIRMGCSRLESIVNDILKTAELESGTVELKKSKEDLSLLIKMCVSELEGLLALRNHTINLEISDDLICSFEKEKMHEVITNILSNAIKFTPYNGKIEVKSEVNNDFVIVSIKDNGIGFTEEEKNQIFKQFGKIERYGQGYDVISEGSGLGLYISKKILELHSGEIWLESEGRDKGSTFYFSLPII